MILIMGLTPTGFRLEEGKFIQLIYRRDGGFVFFSVVTIFMVLVLPNYKNYTVCGESRRARGQ